MTLKHTSQDDGSDPTDSARTGAGDDARQTVLADSGAAAAADESAVHDRQSSDLVALSIEDDGLPSPDTMTRTELAALILDCLEEGRAVPDDAAHAFQTRHRQDVFEHCDMIVALPRWRVPDTIPDEEAGLIEDAVGMLRRVQLDRGATPTARERRLWREAFIERALMNGDADVTSSVNLVPVSDGERHGYAVATVCGYSFSGVEITWHGFARDVEAAYALLRPSFHLSGDPPPGEPVLVWDRGGRSGGLRGRRRSGGRGGSGRHRSRGHQPKLPSPSLKLIR
jgi:hypothetical protein